MTGYKPVPGDIVQLISTSTLGAVVDHTKFAPEPFDDMLDFAVIWPGRSRWVSYSYGEIGRFMVMHSYAGKNQKQPKQIKSWRLV